MNQEKTHIGLFEGIGGFSLAAEEMDWKTIAWCEINPFGQKVLRYYWKEAKEHYDIKETDFTIYKGKCFILTGGFPCQPYSQAGKRLGKEDDRHLWPEMLRSVREIQPRWVVGENVRGLVNWSGGLVFDEVQADLEAEGYEVQPFILPACAKNAPHRRDRIWFVAYRSRDGYEQSEKFKEIDNRRIQEGLEQRHESHSQNGIGNATDTNDKGLERGKIKGSVKGSGQERNEQLARCFQSAWQDFPTQPPICSGDDGLSSRLAGITFPKFRNESIKAYGNAIVPQVAYEIFKAIEQYENEI